jgi:hypothetical protein
MLFKLVTFLLIFFPMLSVANGALAIDGNQAGRYGFSYDQPNLAAASRVALNQCGINCFVIRTFNQGCAAYAADQTPNSTIYGWSTANNGNAARQIAMEYCRKQGGKSCIIRVWACNSN